MGELVEAPLGPEVVVEVLGEDERVGDQRAAGVVADEQRRLVGGDVLEPLDLGAEVVVAPGPDRRQRALGCSRDRARRASRRAARRRRRRAGRSSGRRPPPSPSPSRTSRRSGLIRSCPGRTHPRSAHAHGMPEPSVARASPRYGQARSVIEPSLIDEASVAVVVADDDRRYVDANAAACDLLGISHDELIGMRVEEITGTPADAIEKVWAGLPPRRRPGRHVPHSEPRRAAQHALHRHRRRRPRAPRCDLHPRAATSATGSRSASASARSSRSWPAAHRARGRRGLSVTSATVETHIRNAMRRLGARNRSHLVTLAILRHEIELRRRRRLAALAAGRTIITLPPAWRSRGRGRRPSSR